MKGLKIERILSLEQLLRWRAEVFRDITGKAPDADMLKATARYYDFHNADGTHVAFEAQLPGPDGTLQPIGRGGVCFHEELPSVENPNGRCARIVNLYVREPHRRSGVGADILRALVDLARFRGCHRIALDSSPEARKFCQALGFHEAPQNLLYSESVPEKK